MAEAENRPLKNPVLSYSCRNGHQLEFSVKRILEKIVWRISPEIRVLGPYRGPYDLEILVNNQKVYVEVKSSLFKERLMDGVRRAFKRDHPEPFFVIGVLQLDQKIYIFTKEEDGIKRMAFNDKTIRRLIAPYLKKK